jgi:serine/threonine protein kinase
MGEVYRARDTKLNRDVAIKVLPDSLVADAERRARFEREARTLAALNHAHIAGFRPPLNAARRGAALSAPSEVAENRPGRQHRS